MMADVTGKCLRRDVVSAMNSSKPPTSKNHDGVEIIESVRTTMGRHGRSMLIARLA
jgi:hypothetical protein